MDLKLYLFSWTFRCMLQISGASWHVLTLSVTWLCHMTGRFFGWTRKSTVSRFWWENWNFWLKMNDCSKWAQNHQFWRSLINFGQEKLSCFNKPKSAKWNQGSHQRFSFRWKNIIPRSLWKVHFYDVKKVFVGNIATNFREQVFLAWYIFSCHEQKKFIKLGERLLGLLVLWLFWTLKWSIRHKLGPSRAIRGPREHARSNCESIRIELIVAFPARSNTSYVFFLSPSLHWTVMRLERQLESFF